MIFIFIAINIIFILFNGNDLNFFSCYGAQPVYHQMTWLTVWRVYLWDSPPGCAGVYHVEHGTQSHTQVEMATKPGAASNENVYMKYYRNILLLK